MRPTRYYVLLNLRILFLPVVGVTLTLVYAAFWIAITGYLFTIGPAGYDTDWTFVPRLTW